jgi:F0F1-type ATP synthase membrane subunit b/b'
MTIQSGASSASVRPVIRVRDIIASRAAELETNESNIERNFNRFDNVRGFFNIVPSQSSQRGTQTQSVQNSSIQSATQPDSTNSDQSQLPLSITEGRQRLVSQVLDSAEEATQKIQESAEFRREQIEGLRRRQQRDQAQIENERRRQANQLDNEAPSSSQSFDGPNNIGQSPQDIASQLINNESLPVENSFENTSQDFASVVSNAFDDTNPANLAVSESPKEQAMDSLRENIRQNSVAGAGGRLVESGMTRLQRENMARAYITQSTTSTFSIAA